MTTESWPARYERVMMGTFGSPQATLVRGKGSSVWDDHGKEYLDLYAGIAVNALGHAHPALIEAVTRQLNTLGHVSNFFATSPQIELAEWLVSSLGGDGKVFFTNSGTEANEAALKATRKTGRTHLVAATGSFHGRTMGALSLTAKAAYREPFEPLPGDVTFVEYGDAVALAEAVTDRTAAVILEPVQGEAGVVIPPREYLADARSITHQRGALLWLDEVQSGVGRTGEWWAHRNAELASGEVQPDLVTVAKGLGGGIPIGACIGLGAAGALLEAGNHGSTFGGNPVACAAALAVVRTLESEALVHRAGTIGRWWAEALREQPGVTAVSEAGLWLGVQLDDALGADAAARLVAAAREQGFLINATGPMRLRLAPALTIAQKQVLEFLEVWPRLIEQVAA